MAAKVKAAAGGKFDKNVVLSVGILVLVFALVVYFYGTLMTGNLTGGKAPTQASTDNNSKLGTLYITSDPDEADVSIDNAVVGVTPLDYDLPAGIHTLILDKQGYQTYSSQVSISPGELTSLNISLTQINSSSQDTNVSANSSNETAAMLTGTGTLSIHSFPSKATVLIDNQTVGNNALTPTVLYNITEGVHIISFEKDGYVPYSTSVIVVANNVTPVSANLTDMDAQFGTLQVWTDPANATVFLDNQSIGTTPLTYNATVDYHFLRFEKEGYSSAGKWVHTNANSVVNVNMTLVAKN